MSDKRSSFHMGNEFNGFAEKVYLKGERNEVTPISQENVRVTPDYSRFALKAIGAMPVVLDPKNMDNTMKKMLGCLPVVNQVVIDRNEADGSYQAGVHISSAGFTANSYPTYGGKTKGAEGELRDYFVITKNTGAKIRSSTVIPKKKKNKDKNVLVSAEPGETVQVIIKNKHIDAKQGKNNDYIWAHVIYKGKVKGWMIIDYLRLDVPRIEEFYELRDKNGEGRDFIVTGKLKETDKITEKNSIDKYEEIVNPIKRWYTMGSYDKKTGKGYKEYCEKINGRWAVAVGPKILDYKYGDSGKVESADIKAFSKCIKVKLKLKKGFNSKKLKKELELECHVMDIKAHTYNYYPDNNYGGKDYVSDTVSNAIAKQSEIKKEIKIPNGIAQTGIRYPNAHNEAVVKYGKVIDGSIIEFCGEKLPGFNIDLDAYELVSIKTNYEKKTRGEDYDIALVLR